MKYKALFFFAALLAAIFLARGPAAAGDLSVAPQVGTLGFGLNAGYQVNDYFKLRANTNYLPYSRSDNVRDVDYRAKLDFFTIGALGDVHVLGGGFRLTGGVYYVDLSLTADAKLTSDKSYTIGGNTYTAQELGTWKGSVEWKTLAPYAGLGYGSGSGNEPGFGFSCDLGALYIGKSSVHFDPSASMRQAAADHGYDLQSDVKKEEDEVKSYADKVQFWPVISFGVVYRF